MPLSVAIVGAGLTGLVAARTLADAGRDVTVFEQHTQPGGRLATRRLGAAVCDHGAQFFSTRTHAFERLVAEWRHAGWPIDVWCRGFPMVNTVADGPAALESRDDGYPRYMVRTGMQDLAARLVAGLDVRLAHHVTAVEPRGGRWLVHAESEEGTSAVRADRLVLTPPGPAAQGLLGDRSAVPADRAFAPTVAVLLELDGPSGVPAPGAVQIPTGPVRWLTDNARKGLSPQPALTVHASDDESAALLELPDGEVVDRVVGHVHPWLGAATVTRAAVERWPYARPVDVHDEPAVTHTVNGSVLVLAGDAYAGPRVEGAALSGLAAAERC